jgi:hypothetical protein
MSGQISGSRGRWSLRCRSERWCRWMVLEEKWSRSVNPGPRLAGPMSPRQGLGPPHNASSMQNATSSSPLHLIWPCKRIQSPSTLVHDPFPGPGWRWDNKGGRTQSKTAPGPPNLETLIDQMHNLCICMSSCTVEKVKIFSFSPAALVPGLLVSGSSSFYSQSIPHSHVVIRFFPTIADPVRGAST